MKMNSEKKITDPWGEIFVETFDELCMKFAGKNKGIDGLGASLCLRYIESNVSTLFTNRGIDDLVRSIKFSGVYQFLGELGEHLSMKIGIIDTSLGYETHTTGLGLMSRRIAMMLAFDKKVLKPSRDLSFDKITGTVIFPMEESEKYIDVESVDVMLLNNKWLLVYCLFLVYFPKTVVYRDMMNTIIENMKNEGKK